MEELKASAQKEKSKPVPLPEAQNLKAKIVEKTVQDESKKDWTKSERKDNSPVLVRPNKLSKTLKSNLSENSQPLSEILDIHKVLRTPHTAEQISALWTVFHASRSQGTGRGFLSASVPLPTYLKMFSVARKYPNFILPLQREVTPDKVEGESDGQVAHEFYFMQWAFHPPPTIPPPSPLDKPLPNPIIPSEHPISTVLFTPLLEYKTRETFATPHLILTFYTELANSHDIVLLRGELTPSPSGSENFILSQQDAQLLALGLQRFFLTEDGAENSRRKERAELLRIFNESPTEFKWEELLKHANPTSV